ncbi:MAG: formate dehydrogenase subunit gamma [Pseudomonadota bacterium]
MRANLLSLRAMLAPLLALVFALSLSSAWAAVPNERAQPAYAEEQTMLQIEGDARAREPGLMSSQSGRVHMDRHFLGQYGASEGNVIVQRGGNTWRVLRNGPIASIAGTILIVVPLLIILFYKTIGPAREEPQSGRKLQRFTRWERQVHWATAISFILLAISGLILTFGKKILLPWMGHDFYSWVAWILKYVHNFIGPLFVLCSIVMFFTFVRRNFYNRTDWQWVKEGGGLISHKHVPAGYFNAGEKSWFWFGVTLLGLVMSITGLVLNFVNFGQTRYVLQVANYLHIIGATLYVAAAMGHIYIGTWGTPGAYEAMRHGTVDENWAKAHHGLWYDDVKAGVPGTPGVAAPGGAPDAPRTPPPSPRPGPAH